MSTTYTRTPEGDQALSGSSGLGDLPLEILRAVGHQSTDVLLRVALTHLPSGKLDDGLQELVDRGLLRQAGEAGTGAEDDEQMRKAQALRAKLRARRHGAPAPGGDEGADAARQREAEEQARLENEAREAEARQRLEQERLERMRREEQEREARDAERRQREQAEREARERERAAAEERLRREAEERAAQAAREAQERAAREAAERAAREKAERERREAEEQERAGAAELMRQRAEVQARLIEEERAWLEAERRAKAAEVAVIEQEQLPEEDVRDSHLKAGRGRRWLLPAVAGVVALLGLALMPFIPISGRVATMESELSARFGEPVRIGAVYLGVLPRPHLRLEDVVVGNARQVHVRSLKASGGTGLLGGDLAAISVIDIESPTLSEEGLAWVLFGKPGQALMAASQVQVRGAKVESRLLPAVPLDATVFLDENGGWKSMNVGSGDKALTAQLTFLGNGARVVMSARTFVLPLGPALSLEDFSARVDVLPAGAQVHEFKGFAFGGWLSGSGKLARGAEWTFSGTLDARRIDVSKLSRAFENAWLVGNASFLMRAPSLAGLGSSLYLDGTFAVPNGILNGIDLGRVLQGGSTRGGVTDFSDIRGSVVHENGVTRLQRMSFAQSKLSAGGNVDIGADGKLQGRLVAEIKLPSETRRAFLGLSGTPDQIEWQRQ